MKYKYIASIMALLIMFSVGGISLLKEDKVKSDLEGRNLQGIPTKGKLIKKDYSEEKYKEELKNGEVFKLWDKYFSDQIVLRSTMVNTYTKLQKALNKNLINGVYFGEDGYVFSEETIKETEIEEIKESVKGFNKFANEFKDSKIYMVPVPHKIMMYEEKMPIDDYETRGNKYLDTFIEGIDKENINCLDYRKYVDKNEEIFFKTDHHWNLNGAYEGYKMIMESIKTDFNEIGEIQNINDFQMKEAKDVFLGSDGRKVSSVMQDLENINTYYNKDLEKCDIYHNGKKREFIYEDVISKDKLNNDYLTYLRGDFDKLTIKNKSADNDLKVVVIGDSMDNILMQFLAPHFKEIYNYDLRKFKKNIKEEIKEVKPDIILMVGLTNNYILGNKGNVFNLEG